MILRNGLVETKENEVAAGDIVPVPGGPLEEALATASPDHLREMIRTFAQKMTDAEVETPCGALYWEASADPVNSRNGYQRRERDTRAGDDRAGDPEAAARLVVSGMAAGPALGARITRAVLVPVVSVLLPAPGRGRPGPGTGPGMAVRAVR